jgi:hypothetical protein
MNSKGHIKLNNQLSSVSVEIVSAPLLIDSAIWYSLTNFRFRKQSTINPTGFPFKRCISVSLRNDEQAKDNPLTFVLLQQ